MQVLGVLLFCQEMLKCRAGVVGRNFTNKPSVDYAMSKQASLSGFPQESESWNNVVVIDDGMSAVNDMDTNAIQNDLS